MEKILFKNWPYRTTPLNDKNLNDLQTNVENALNNKVDKVEGKGLSTNDYTTTEKNKLGGIEAGANKTTIADNLTTDDSTKVLSAKQGKELNDRLNNLLDMFYPVGTIYETTSTDLDTTTKMANHFGGTWELFGTGRITVGYDSSQTEFNTIGKTGGAKTHTLTVAEMPSHKHDVVIDIPGRNDGLSLFNVKLNKVASPYVDPNITRPVGGGQPHNNLQPYIVVYRYRRIT